MRLRFYALLTVLLAGWLAGSCITDFQPDAVSVAPALIVEGMITDQPGPYLVKLSRTANYSYKSLNLLETGATVTIRDDAGNAETLTEGGGTYNSKPGGIQGVVGRTYQLIIKTKDGRTYESQPELLTASPPIQNIYYEYTFDPQALTSDKQNGWNLYVDTKDPTTPGDYYRWDWTHYEAQPICQINELPSGARTGNYCCQTCWDITRCYTCLTILSDADINGNTISRQLVERVPYTSGGKYYVEVRQQHLSRGVYTFLNTTKQLTQNTGGLFDAAPANVGGNLRCTSDANVAVYGYFGAAGESVAHISLDRSNAVGSPPVLPPVNVSPFAPCVPCVESAYRTQKQPRWWTY